MSLADPARRDLIACLDAAAHDWLEMWGSHGDQLPPGSGAVVDLLATAHEHLEGLRTLVETGRTADASIITLSRSIVECSARAWWLVEPDQPEDREARLVLESRYATEESKRVLEDLGSELDPEARTQIQRRIDGVDAYVTQLKSKGWSVTRDAIRDQRRPGMARVLRHFTESVAEARYGLVIFHLASAVAHGQRGGVDFLGDFEPSLGRRRRPQQPPYGEVPTSVVGVALVCFDAAVRRVARVFGWNEGSFGDSLKEPLAGLRSRGAYALGVRDKLGRNDPCGCGSGRKFKECHGWS